jgi:hypothetical protein
VEHITKNEQPHNIVQNGPENAGSQQEPSARVLADDKDGLPTSLHRSASEDFDFDDIPSIRGRQLEEAAGSVFWKCAYIDTCNPTYLWAKCSGPSGSCTMLRAKCSFSTECLVGTLVPTAVHAFGRVQYCNARSLNTSCCPAVSNKILVCERSAFNHAVLSRDSARLGMGTCFNGDFNCIQVIFWLRTCFPGSNPSERRGLEFCMSERRGLTAGHGCQCTASPWV